MLDTIDTCQMGMHSGITPQLLTKSQLSSAVNVTCRGGKPGTRPSLRKMALAFTDDDPTLAQQAIFQCASYYQGFGNNPNCLMASIGGCIFRYQIAQTSATVQKVSGTEQNDPTLDQAWMFQGEDFLIINDGQSRPLIWDGASMRRAAVGTELPAGCMGVYVNGRIVMALPNRRSYIAGDLVYSSGASGGYNGRDSILKISQNLAILGGAAFAIPVNAGPITAMFTVAILDTSLGQGPLQVGTRKGVFGVNLPLDANLWTTTQQPSQVVSLPSRGPASQNSVVQVNADAWYRSSDGIRSFGVARRDYNTWVQTALSFELQAILPKDTQRLLDHASAVEFNNRLVMTCSPYRVPDRGIAHRGLVALDFNNVSSLTTRSQPDYDGLWTGLNVLQIVTGEFDGTDRCFVFALDKLNNIALYELMDDDAAKFDFNGTEDVRTECWISSNALFGRQELPASIRLPQKKLICADSFFDKISGTVDYTFEYRSDGYPNWTPWKSFSFCAKSCITKTDCVDAGEVMDLFATFRRLPEPPDVCSEITGRNLRTGYFFELKLSWTGQSSINQILVWATQIPETVGNVCVAETCKGLKICSDNFFTYQIES